MTVGMATCSSGDRPAAQCRCQTTGWQLRTTTQLPEYCQLLSHTGCVLYSLKRTQVFMLALSRVKQLSLHLYRNSSFNDLPT